MKKGYGPSAPSAPWPPGGPSSGLFPALLVRASFRCAHSGARKCARIWTTWMANSLDDPFFINLLGSAASSNPRDPSDQDRWVLVLRLTRKGQREEAEHDQAAAHHLDSP